MGDQQSVHLETTGAERLQETSSHQLTHGRPGIIGLPERLQGFEIERRRLRCHDAKKGEAIPHLLTQKARALLQEGRYGWNRHARLLQRVGRRCFVEQLFAATDFGDELLYIQALPVFLMEHPARHVERQRQLFHIADKLPTLPRIDANHIRRQRRKQPQPILLRQVG